MNTEQEETSAKAPLSISVKSIAIAVVAFVLGVVAVFLITNFLAKEQTEWSTGSLLSLVFTVALGVASVTLTWIAYRMSKDSEEKLTNVFLKTNEVLSSIQTSTGVTERRVEDIISGRVVNVIAAGAVEKSRQGHLLTEKAAEQITKDVAESLRQDLIPLLSAPPSEAENILVEKEKTLYQRAQARASWATFRASIISSLRALPNVKIFLEHEGTVIEEDPSRFWDAIIEIAGKRIGIDIHTENAITSYGSLSFFLPRCITEILSRVNSNEIDLAFIVIDTGIWQTPEMAAMRASVERFNVESEKERVFSIYGPPESIAMKIQSISMQEATDHSADIGESS